jgi:hypothetical protein
MGALTKQIAVFLLSNPSGRRYFYTYLRFSSSSILHIASSSGLDLYKNISLQA